jgi:2-keto-4-pentenoate hydratase
LVGLGPLDKADAHGVSIENGNVVFGGSIEQSMEISEE